jgi:hypothetical protein
VISEQNRVALAVHLPVHGFSQTVPGSGVSQACGIDAPRGDSTHGSGPKTGQFTEYLLPRQTNIRRVFVDNSTTPVTFWVGNNESASIIKLEPFNETPLVSRVMSAR